MTSVPACLLAWMPKPNLALWITSHNFTFYFGYHTQVTSDRLISFCWNSSGNCLVHKDMCVIVKPKSKRMVRFQKLTNLFLTLHGQNVHHQQRQMSKFLMRYQQFASHAYCRAGFQDGVAAGKGFLCASFWGVQICDYSAAWVSCTV